MASSSCPAVVDEKHCHDEELKLEMKEEWWTASGGFVIKDIQGKEYFQVKNHLLTHELLDMEGNKVADLVKKKMAIRITFHIYAGEEMSERRATMNLRAMSLKKKAHVYLYEPPYPTQDDPTDLGDMKPALKIKAENCGSWINEAKIVNAETKEVYAEMSKSAAKEELEGAGCKTYVMTVKPGVDVAFMSMCALFFNVAIKEEAGGGAS